MTQWQAQTSRGPFHAAQLLLKEQLVFPLAQHTKQQLGPLPSPFDMLSLLTCRGSEGRRTTCRVFGGFLRETTVQSCSPAARLGAAECLATSSVKAFSRFPGFVRTRLFRSVRRSSSASASSSSSHSMLCTSVLRPARSFSLRLRPLAADPAAPPRQFNPPPLCNEEASTLLGKGTAMQGTRREDHIRPNIVNVEKVPISSAMPQRSRFRRLLRRLPTRMQL